MSSRRRWPRPQHDFVLTKDSNITLDPGSLAAMMQSFTGTVGLVVAVPVAVRPSSLAGRVEACLINGHARLLLASAMIGLGFGVGKVMLFRRSDLERIGGVTALSRMLAEDTASVARARAAWARDGLRARDGRAGDRRPEPFAKSTTARSAGA